MTARRNRLVGALATALAGAALAGVTVWINLMLDLGPRILGFGHGMTPGIEVTPLSLAFDIGFAALLLVPPLAVLATFSGPWPFRALSLAMFGYGWYWLGEGIAGTFAVDFGTTWAPGEAFAELFWRPGITPTLWTGAMLGYLFLLSRLNHPRPDLHQGAQTASR